jgi:hypothetical protein
MEGKEYIFRSNERFHLISINDNGRMKAVLESVSHRLIFLIPRLLHLPVELDSLEVSPLNPIEDAAFRRHLAIPFDTEGGQVIGIHSQGRTYAVLCSKMWIEEVG